MDKLLSREEILSQRDRQYEVVEVPEWGGSVRVRSLTGAERDEYEAGMVMLRGNKMIPKLRQVRARLVSMSVVDEEGATIFTPEDVHGLGDLSAAALERVFDVARKLSGLTDKDVEELAETFEPARSEGDTSG